VEFAGWKKVLQASVRKLRKVLAFTKGAVKKVFESSEMCWHLLKELLKKGWQA